MTDITIPLMEHLMSLPTVGELKAKRIIQTFGADKVPDVLDKQPDMLTLVHGIRKKAAERILSQWRQRRPELDAAIERYRIQAGASQCASQN